MLLVCRILKWPCVVQSRYLLCGPVQRINELDSQLDACDLKLIWNCSNLESLVLLHTGNNLLDVVYLHIENWHPFHDDTPTNWTVLTLLWTEAADTNFRKQIRINRNFNWWQRGHVINSAPYKLNDEYQNYSPDWRFSTSLHQFCWYRNTTVHAIAYCFLCTQKHGQHTPYNRSSMKSPLMHHRCILKQESSPKMILVRVPFLSTPIFLF